MISRGSSFRGSAIVSVGSSSGSSFSVNESLRKRLSRLRSGFVGLPKENVCQGGGRRVSPKISSEFDNGFGSLSGVSSSVLLDSLVYDNSESEVRSSSG